MTALRKAWSIWLLGLFLAALWPGGQALAHSSSNSYLTLRAPEGKLMSTLVAVTLGTGLWAAFFMGGLHLWLVGVMPFTRAG